MSELKAIHAFDVYEAYTKTGDDDAAQVYLKSEADKVIAEKDKEIARLDDLAHANYKRCLAMAMWCRSRACFYDTMRENNLYWGMKSDRAYKWYKRWLTLAEKFKPNPTINKKGGTNALQR